MTFGKRFEGWTAFEVGCVGISTKYAFGWAVSVFEAVFCMMIFTVHEATRLVTMVSNYLYSRTPDNSGTEEAHS